MSSLTPGGSSIAPSTRESKEEREDAGPSVSLRGPISSSAPLSESRSLGEADNLTMRVAMRSISGYAPKMLAHLLPQHVVPGERADRFEALPDASRLQQRPLQPTPEGAGAHRGAGAVHRLDQVVEAEVAPRRGVENHPRARVIGPEGDHLLRRVAAAQGGEVLDQSPRGPSQRGPPIQPVPLEPRDPEVPLERLLPRRRLERPARRRAHGGPHLRQFLRRGPLGNHDLPRRPPLQLGRQLLLGDLGTRKLPRRSLHDRYASHAVPDHERGEIIRMAGGRERCLL